MSTLFTFGQLGFRHIVDIGALDHILFLVALAVIYRLRDAKNAIGVITAFTIGHSITLGLAVTGVLRLPVNLVEFLIPVTIVVTCVENLVAGLRRSPLHNPWRPLIAGTFGLVHGAGFASYLQSMFVERVALPLFGFNAGIELGQMLMLCVIGVALAGLDRLIERLRAAWPAWPAVRLRVVGVSVAIALVASQWAWERSPW